MLAGNKIKIN